MGKWNADKTDCYRLSQILNCCTILLALITSQNNNFDFCVRSVRCDRVEPISSQQSGEIKAKAGLELLKSEQAKQLAPNKTIKDFVGTKYNCYFAISK